MIETLLSLVSIVLLCASAVTRPARALCPVAWHDEGVRADGEFGCRPDPVGDPDQDGVWGHPDVSVQQPGEVWGRIYCTGGAHPIVVDERAVGCQR